MRSRLRPGSLVPGRGLMRSRCCAPGRLPWLMADASRRSPWCSLVPGLCSMSPGGRLVLALSLVLVPSLADASRWSPWCLLAPGLWLMSPGCALARSSLAYARCFQVCPWHLSAWSCVELRPLVACPGLWLMSPGGRPGARSSLVVADALQNTKKRCAISANRSNINKLLK